MSVKQKLLKGIMCWAAACLMAVMCCGQALAAASAQPVRVFVYENTLYTYVKLDGIDRPVTQVEAKIGSQSFGTSTRLETVRQAGFPITYLLLVDNSTSMPPFRGQLEEFCSQLVKSSGENTRFILATLGDSFQIINEDIPAETMAEQIAALPFDEDVTRLHTCMNSALDYFESLPRQGNELRSMIVITDAVQYDPQGGIPFEELLDRIKRSDVMLHSLGMGSDAAALEKMGELTEASGGMHQVAGESLAPAAAADELSEEGGELMVVGFDLTGCAASGEDEPVSFTFASGGTLLCKGEANVDIPLSGEAQAEGESQTEPSAEGTPSDSSQSSQETSENSALQSGSGETKSAAAREKGGDVWIAAGVAAVLAIIIILYLINRRKRAERIQTPLQKIPKEYPEGIFVRLDDPDGILISRRKEFSLTKELIAGGSDSCDIVLSEEKIPPRALRIFIENSRVYVEPLVPQLQVLVNDQPALKRQALRSGDRITIAGQTFRLMF